MSFLDNSGDIILDAVITDAGRKRMAEGKFNITKYAFGDEEINYGLFNNAHPSGSAFYDLQIMQTPIFEAFTNNTSTMSSKLMTLNDNNYLYLPVLRLNESWGTPQISQIEQEPKAWSARVGKTQLNRAAHLAGEASLASESETGAGNPDISTNDNGTDHAGFFVITCDASTEDLWQYHADGVGGEARWSPDTRHYSEGVIFGASDGINQDASFICVDQGILGATEGLSVLTPFPAELRETAYLIRIDHRLGRIAVAPQRVTTITTQNGNIISEYAHGRNAPFGNAQAVDNARPNRDRRLVQPYAFVDDDHIATYYITNQSDVYGANILNSYSGASPDRAYLDVVDQPAHRNVNTGAQTKCWLARQIFNSGPVGSRLQFTIRAQDTVKLSYDLFDTSQEKDLWRDSDDARAELAAGDLWVIESTRPLDANDQYQYPKISVHYIDSVVTITGVTTGYSLNIPVRFVKKAAS